jgi:hypothetical protein
VRFRRQQSRRRGVWCVRWTPTECLVIRHRRFDVAIVDESVFSDVDVIIVVIVVFVATTRHVASRVVWFGLETFWQDVGV